MTIFALDTSSYWGSVALRRDEVQLGSREFFSTTGFGDVLFTEVETLFRNANLELAAVDCFAAAAGPGSFTGLRLALSTIKGLGEVWRKRVCGISNLRALSSFRKRPKRPAAVVSDARRGLFYLGSYNQDLSTIGNEFIGELPAWLSNLDDPTRYEFVSQDSSEALRTELARLGIAAEVTEAPRALASAVALCASTLR